MEKKKIYFYAVIIIALVVLIGIGAFLFGRIQGKGEGGEPTVAPSPTEIVSPTPEESPTPTTTIAPTKKTVTLTPTQAPTTAPSVTPTPSEFKVTSVSAGTVPPTDFTGACPHQFTFNASITVNKSGNIKYKWERSDGATGPETTINFAAPGSQDASTTWTLGGSGTTYSGWERVKIISPNDISSNQAVFSLNCNP